MNADGLNQLIGDVHWAIHELGHSYANAVGSFSDPNFADGRSFTLPSLLEYFQQNFGFPDRPPESDRNSTWGFAGGRWEWQRSISGAASEEFADMFLGWVYNRWETEAGSLSVAVRERAILMNALMSCTVDMAISR